MAENQRATPKFEVIEYEGKPARKYPNGDIRNEHGNLIKISPERAFEMQKRRKEQGTQVARQAIKKYTQSATVAEGIEKIVGKRVELAMKGTGRDSNDAARLALLMAGAYAVNQPLEVKTNIQQNNVRYELPKEYLDALNQLRREGVIEGETNDEG